VAPEAIPELGDEDEEKGSEDEDSEEDEDEENEGSGSESDEDALEPSKEERDLFSMSLRERQKRIKARLCPHIACM
jgi:hypothetical protein